MKVTKSHKFFAAMAWVMLATIGLTGCGGGGSSGGQPPVTVYARANSLEAGFARQLQTLEDNGIRVLSYKCQAGGQLEGNEFGGPGDVPYMYGVYLLVTTDTSAMGILDAVQERVKRGDSSSPLSEFKYLPIENPSSVLQLHYEPLDCSRLWTLG